MANQLSQMVAAQAGKAVTMSLQNWLIKNELPSYVETKWDGVRVWFIKSKDAVVIATKHNGVYTQKEYPDMLTLVPNSLPKQLILDCEWIKSTDMLYVFDVINLDGKDCKDLPLRERKQLLKTLALAPCTVSAGHILEVSYTTVSSRSEIEDLRDKVINTGGEGVMVKNPASRYGDANAWLKVKRFDTFDVFVTGRDHTHEGPTYYIACYNDAGQLIDLGKVGSFIKNIDYDAIKYGSVLEVRFQEVTKEKRLRHPVCIKIRDDKTQKECINPV